MTEAYTPPSPAPSVARMGVTPGAMPEGVYVLDATGAWVPIGSVNSTLHTFYPSPSLSFTDHASLLVGAIAPPVTPSVISQSGFSQSGDGGWAEYDWNPTSTLPIDNLFVVAPVGWPGGTPGRYIIRLQNSTINVASVGFNADGVTDNTPSMAATLAYEASNSPGSGNNWNIRFGPGNYYFSQPIELHIQTVLEGLTSGYNNAAFPTTLTFNDDIPGIVIAGSFECWQYGYSITLCPTGYAGGSVIKNLHITTKSGTLGQTQLLPTSNGIWMRQRAEINHVRVDSFGNDCVHIAADGGSHTDTDGNADGWILNHVYPGSCVANGTQIVGSDVNAGYSTGNNSTNNGGFGLRDDAFLTDLHMSPQSSGDGTFHDGLVGGIGPTITHVTYGDNQYRLIQQGNTLAQDQTVLPAAQVNPPSGAATDNTWWHWIQAGGPDFGVAFWGQVVENNIICTVIPGQEAIMWVNDPLTTPGVWDCSGLRSPGWIARVNGTATVGETIGVTFTSSALAGSPITVTATAAGGDTLSTIAGKLVTAINANGTLSTAGVIGNNTDSHVRIYQPNALTPQPLYGAVNSAHMSISVYQIAYIDWTVASKVVNAALPYQDHFGHRPSGFPYGPYVAGGSYRNSTSDAVWVNPYMELGEYSAAHFWTGIISGGVILTTFNGPGYRMSSAISSVSSGAGGPANGRSLNFTSPIVTPFVSGRLLSGTANNTDFAGQIALSGGSATYNFQYTYGRAPVCMCKAGANACSVAETTTGLTFSGTGSDTVRWFCAGQL